MPIFQYQMDKKIELNKIHCGACEIVMRDIDSNSVDCIVTDPPYGLSFMGKNWDKAVPSVAIWEECLRVLKPGVFAFIMCIPRQDCLARMICRLEDAGFNVAFSSIYWTYACLSEDTEILTKEGWVLWHIAKGLNSSILIYNYEEDNYKWEIPTQWHYYKIQDTCYRIKSDFTEQIVTRGHRVAIEQEGKILFRLAGKIRQKVRVPYLDNLRRVQKDISCVPGTNQSSGKAKGKSKILQSKMQWKGKSTLQDSIQQRTWNRGTILERGKEREAKTINDGRKELGMERGSNLFQKAWQLWTCKICTLSKRVFEHGTQRRICDGASLISSTRIRKAFVAIRNGASYRSRSNKQQFEEFDVIPRQSRSQTARRRKSYKTTLATITEEEYEGIVFCPTVSTGCFVARRKGKIFITGNSGFPKAQNLSKAADKRNGRTFFLEFKDYLNEKRKEKNLSLNKINVMIGGAITGGGTASSLMGNKEFNELPTLEIYTKLKIILDLDNRFDELIEREEAKREVIGRGKSGIGTAIKNGGWSGLPAEDFDITIPALEQAKALEGAYAGMQLKPAVEVVIVAMKSLEEKTYIDQAMSNGHGCTWLDDCRIPYESKGEKEKAVKREEIPSQDIRGNAYCKQNNPNIDNVRGDYSKGRFPANVLCEDNVLDDGRIIKPSTRPNIENKVYPALQSINFYGKKTTFNGYPDEGSFSRYFSLDAWFAERIKQLPKEAQKTFPFMIIPKASKSEKNRGLKDESNIHPTCKSIKLMSWLITLASREGEIVLDPFCGSGTTCIAAKMLGRQYIGIEREEDYCEIARKRISAIPTNLSRF